MNSEHVMVTVREEGVSTWKSGVLVEDGDIRAAMKAGVEMSVQVIRSMVHGGTTGDYVGGKETTTRDGAYHRTWCARPAPSAAGDFVVTVEPPQRWAAIYRYADKIVRMVREDAESGMVPWTVRTFGELHDHVDANMYLEHAGQVYDGTGASTEEIIGIQNAVTAMLAAGELSGRMLRLTWTVSDQHEATFCENAIRSRLGLDNHEPITVEALAGLEEHVEDMSEGVGDTWSGTVEREIEQVAAEPDRELTPEEAQLLGILGRYGYPAARWSGLTDEMQHQLAAVGGTVGTTATLTAIRSQVLKATLIGQLMGNPGDAPTYADIKAAANGSATEDLPTPTLTFTEIKASLKAGPPHPALAELVEAIDQVEQLNREASRLCDEANESGHPNGEMAVRAEAGYWTEIALNRALHLLGIRND